MSTSPHPVARLSARSSVYTFEEILYAWCDYDDTFPKYLEALSRMHQISPSSPQYLDFVQRCSSLWVEKHVVDIPPPHGGSPVLTTPVGVSPGSTLPPVGGGGGGGMSAFPGGGGGGGMLAFPGGGDGGGMLAFPGGGGGDGMSAFPGGGDGGGMSAMEGDPIDLLGMMFD